MFSSKNVYVWTKKAITREAADHAAELKTEKGKKASIAAAVERCAAFDQKLATLKTMKKLASAEISVEWNRSRIWGMNPTVTARIRSGETYEITTGHASGCGYDKLSAAVASALNDSDIIRATMIRSIRKLNAKEGRTYGLYDTLALMGGCGVNCYRSIFELIGYTWKHEEGRTYDHITIERKTNAKGVK